MQLIIYCLLGNSLSLKSQSGLYSAIHNCLTTPDLRYISTDTLVSLEELASLAIIVHTVGFYIEVDNHTLVKFQVHNYILWKKCSLEPKTALEFFLEV